MKILKLNSDLRIKNALAFCALLAVGFTGNFAHGQSVQFTGGSCASQGDWVQGALDQSASITAAITALRDDPNCTALVKTLDNGQKLGEMTQTKADSAGMSSVYQELQSLKQYLGNSETNKKMPSNFREIVNYMVFRKSLDTVKNAGLAAQIQGLNADQKANLDLVSGRLKNFLQRADTVSKLAVMTTKSVMAAIPQSKLCFAKRPNEAALIFSSVVSSAAALASGGQITNVGEMVSSLVQFSREIEFANMLSGVELERYRASMSCMVETTQEAYCSLQDAQDSLNFMRGVTPKEGKIVEYAPQTSAENSMQGLLILLRDTPIITAWMQKILFGIDPKLQIEADMKNANWDAIIKFIKSKNTLPATYSDKKQVYNESSKGMDNANKLALVKDMVAALQQSLGGGFGGRDNTLNFFQNALNPDAIPFFLIGAEIPADFNPIQNNFDSIFIKWQREQSHGFNNPDKLVDTMGDQLSKLIEQASSLSSSYFSSRMIVDSQNLLVEGMNGPSISPYQALQHINVYLGRLVIKLQKGIDANAMNTVAYKTTIPLLQDLQMRIQKITTAMEQVSDITKDGNEIVSRDLAARKRMDVIYELANMLSSRDSFIANRIANAVRMDISDTLWRNEELDDRQQKVLRVLGKDVVIKLSRYFNNDPVLQRLDVAQAEPIHLQNLAAVESLFADTYWYQIKDINCRLKGGLSCTDQIEAPTIGFWQGYLKKITNFATFQPIADTFRGFSRPSDDSAGLRNLRAKLCAQTLGFQQFGDRFAALCSGSVIQSEFDDQKGTKGLNLSYDDSRSEMLKLRSSKEDGHMSAARVYGSCTLRSYIRKNVVYRMYTDLAQ